MNVLYNHIVKLLKHKLYFFILQNLLTVVYHVTLIKIFNEFKQRFKNVYVNNFYWIKILNVIISKNVVNRSSSIVISTSSIVISKNVVDRTSRIVTLKNIVNNTSLVENNRTTKTSNQFVNKLFRDIRFRLRNNFYLLRI